MLCRLLVFGLLAACAADAAVLSGIVTSAGIPIPGASVTATHSGKTLSAVTDDDGRYSIADVEPGVWSVEVQIFGFTPSKSDVNVAADTAAKDWTIQLRPPAMRQQQQNAALQRRPGFQSLDVAQRANMAELTRAINAGNETTPNSNGNQTDAGDAMVVSGSISNGLQQAISQEQVFAQFREQQLQQGENPFGGNNGAPGGGGPGGPGGPGGGFGGGRGGFGGGGFGGRGGFGGPGGPGGRRGPGGPWQGRNGTFGNRVNRNRNAIRGSAFFTAHDSIFDATPYSLSGLNVAKPSYSQFRFGAVVGGALNIPKIIHSDRTFFFLSYNGNRATNPFDAWATVPTLAERSGDFSQASIATGPVTIYNPLTHQPFANNVIPSSMLNPASVALLQYFPLPNQSNGIQNYHYVNSYKNDTDNLGIRVNQTLTAKDRLNVAFNMQRRAGVSLQLFGFTDPQDGTGLSANTSWSHTFTPAVVNNLSLNYSRNRSQVLPYFANGADVATALGILGTSTDPINFGPPNLTFTNFGALTDGTPSLIRNQTVSLGNSVMIVKGAHTITTGGDVRRIQLNIMSDQNGRGAYSFSGLLTSAFDANGLPIANTGYDFADFLIGLPQTAAIRYGSTSNYFRATSIDAYASDVWKIRSNLTINAGLRYEFFTPYTEKYGRLANLDVAPGFTNVAVVTPGTVGPYSGKFPDGLVNSDPLLLSPRLGLAWKPRNEGSTVVRLGYGIYYNGSVYNQFPTQLASQPPFANALSITTSLAAPLTIQDGFTLVTPQTIKNTWAIARNYTVGNAQTWSASIQQNLPKSLIVEVGYLGTKGTHLDIERSPNRAAPGSPLTAEQRRQIENASGFIYESSDGNSIYHAGHLRLTRRFAKGISFNLLYTYSKSIDNSSTLGGSVNAVAQNDLDLAAERGLSSFNRTHVLTGNYIFTSPFDQQGLFPISNGKLRAALQDWTLSGSVTAQTGLPFTARVLGNLSNTGGTGAVGSERADATGLPLDTGVGFFNPLAFSIPVAGTFGNAGRNTIIGPSGVVLNLSLSRSFRLKNERQRLEFRVDATNFTNSVNITSFGTVLNSNTFNVATAAGSMRTVSMTARFRF